MATRRVYSLRSSQELDFVGIARNNRLLSGFVPIGTSRENLPGSAHNDAQSGEMKGVDP